MTEIKYCPFCNGEGVPNSSVNEREHFITCCECGACTRIGWTLDEAIEAWNKRLDSNLESVINFILTASNINHLTHIQNEITLAREALIRGGNGL
jgi:transcription elongation factor Elf1